MLSLGIYMYNNTIAEPIASNEDDEVSYVHYFKELEIL